LIVDEVKSGTGMGTALNLIKRTMQGISAESPRDLDVCFYAIRPGAEDEMTDELRETVNRWSGSHTTSAGKLNVRVTHFAGPLVGYDNAPMCGIDRKSLSADQDEAYELLKLNGGLVKFRCENNSQSDVLQAAIKTNNNCLVEFLSYCAVSWTSRPRRSISKQLMEAIGAHSCDRCRELFQNVYGLAQ
jgi:hypothetical protein